MAENLKPEWRVIQIDGGHVLYRNDKTGEETKESPYLAKLNKYRNCDLVIWQSRREECVSFALVHPRPRVNLDLNFGEKVGGRITLELFADIAPLAAYNFYCLCSNEFPDINGQALKLKGSFFHRCIKDMGMAGGDITNGTGGISIFGAPFEDENTNRPLDRAGQLICVSDGPNLNLSKFIITSGPVPSLFGQASLFGRVVRGLAVVRTAMGLEADADGHPSEMVVIANTSVAPDGPIPEDFTIPAKPSLRQNPMVPPACASLLGGNVIIGQSHDYSVQRHTEETPVVVPAVVHVDTPVAVYSAASTQETMDGEEPAPPGEDMVPDAPVDVTTEYDMNGYATTGYDTTGYDVNNEGNETPNDNMPVKRNIPDYSSTASFNAASGSFISSGMDDFRRGSMPKDGDGRALAHFLDLSSLDTHSVKKKISRIPPGFKTWKEYGDFKKKEKRARQVHDILEDKYPVEFLERSHHKCCVCFNKDKRE